MPEPKTPAHSKRLALIAAVFAVAFPVLLIVLMVWSPGFLEAAGRILEPIRLFLDKMLEGWTALWIVAIPVLAFPVIVVHELGHLVAGLAVRFRFVSIRFGILQITPPFHLSFKREPKTGASGYVQMVPSRSQNLRLRSFIFLLGGPFANLISGGTLLFFDSRLPALSVFAVLSIVVGAVNLVPFQRLALTSDGKRIFSILRNDQRSERWLSILHLIAELRNGADFEDLSSDFLAKATSIKDESGDTVAAYAFAYSAAWYKQSADDAAQLLETCLAYSAFTTPEMRDALRSDAAVFQARKRKRIDLAQQWLAEIPEQTDNKGRRPRVEAAMLEAQGDIQGALSKLNESAKAVQAIPHPLQRSLSLRSLERWRSELQVMNAAKPPSMGDESALL